MERYQFGQLSKTNMAKIRRKAGYANGVPTFYRVLYLFKTLLTADPNIIPCSLTN